MKHANMAPRRLPVRSITFALTLLAGWPVLAGEPLWPEPAIVPPEQTAQMPHYLALTRTRPATVAMVDMAVAAEAVASRAAEAAASAEAAAERSSEF